MSDEWTPVAEKLTSVEANLARVHLQAAGIEALLDEDAGAATWAVTGISGVRVLVRQAELERAAEVLAAHPSGESVDDADEDEVDEAEA
jgi:hypothetical protein